MRVYLLIYLQISIMIVETVKVILEASGQGTIGRRTSREEGR